MRIVGIALTIWLALPDVPSAQEAWLCTADQWVGFRFDKEVLKWLPDRLNIENRYIVRPISEGSLFFDPKLPKEITQYGVFDEQPDGSGFSDVSFNDCYSGFFLIEGGDKSDIGQYQEQKSMVCTRPLHSLSAQFAFDREYLRFVRTYLGTYISQWPPNDPDPPSIEIGRCSPLYPSQATPSQ